MKFFGPVCFFLLQLLCLGKSQAVPAPRQKLSQVEYLLGAWQVSAAQKKLETAIEQAPLNRHVMTLRAEILFLQGQYQAALDVLNRIKNGSKHQSSSLELKKLVSATLEAVKGYTSYRSAKGHFIIWTQPGKDEILAPFAAETLETMHDVLHRDLGFSPDEPIRVEIYPRPEVLAQVSPLTIKDINRSGTIALCKYNRLMMVTPRALLRGYAWRDAIAHELTHMAVARLSYNSIPIWIHEGIAKFFEARWRQSPEEHSPLSPTQEHLLAQALRSHKFIKWKQMHPSMAKLPNQRATALAFAQVQTAIEVFVDKAGIKGLRRLIADMKQGRPAWESIKRLTKLSRPRFQKLWIRDLRSRKLRLLSDLVPSRVKFGKHPSKEQELAQVKELHAQRFLRIAEMLRARRFTRAAIIEYEKARKFLGQRDPLVANQLARSYLEISSPAQAIGAILPVLEYYPEYPGPQVTIGIAYLRAGNPTAAEKHLKVALRLNPFDPAIHCNLVNALKATAPKEAKLHASICNTLR